VFAFVLLAKNVAFETLVERSGAESHTRRWFHKAFKCNHVWTFGRKDGDRIMKRILAVMMIVSVVLSMFAVFTPKAIASENVIFQDDFESYAVGTFPSAGGWSIVWNGAGNQYQIITSATYVSPTRSFQLVGRPSWSVVVKKDFSSSSHLIGYEVFMRASDYEGRGYAGFGNIPIEQWGRLYAGVGFWYGVINAGGQNLQSFTPGVWYGIRVVLDRNTRMFDVWIDGVLKGKDLVEQYDPWEILSFEVAMGWLTKESYFDDVKVFEVSGTPPQNGLVGYWNFDEGSGNAAADSSGNGNTGTLINSPVWTDAKNGKALSFDGTTNYVQISDSSSLDMTAQLTLETWIYPRAYVDSTGMVSHIISRCDYSGGHIYVLSMYPNSHKISYSVNPYSGEKSSIADLPLNVWTHLAMTYDGSHICLYVNGELDSSYAQTGPIYTTSNWLAIGCKPTGPWGGVGTYAYFNGMIDEVRIYNRALTQQEIQTDMGVPGPPSQTGSISGVVFYLDSEGNVVTIPGATVSLTYTSYTTTTDGYGRYTLTNIPFDRWMMSSSVAGYPERNEYATINDTYPDATVHFCMKAQIMDDLKGKAISALNNIATWLQTEAQHIDGFATEHALQLAQAYIETWFGLVLGAEGVSALDIAIVNHYLVKGLISSPTTRLADIINGFRLSGSSGIYPERYGDLFSSARQEIEQSFRPIDSASMFKYPRSFDPQMKAYVKDVSDHYESIATNYFWLSTAIDDSIKLMEEESYMLRYVYMVAEGLAIAGETAVILAPGVGWVVGGTVAMIGIATQAGTLVIQTGEYIKGYAGVLLPLFFRNAEKSKNDIKNVKDSLSDAFEKATRRNQNPSFSIPSIQVMPGEHPSFSINNTFVDDVYVNAHCIAELYFPELVGKIESTSYLFRYEEPVFLTSPGEERGFNIKYPNEAVQWIDSVKTKISSPTKLVISLVVYANYGEESGAEYAARKQIMTWITQEYPANYNEFELHSSCDLHVYDSSGRHTGLNYTTNGVDCEIPHSLYYMNDIQRILILDPSGRYTVRLIGTSDGEYHLNVKSVFATVVGSEQWINGTIISGQTLDYHIYIESSGVPIVDNTPPTTKIEFGRPSIKVGEEFFVTASTAISLNAADNVGGSGVSLTTYRIHNSTYASGWVIYSGSFDLSLLNEGTYTIAFNSTDNAGNVEPTNTIQVTLFSWTCIFTDSYGRGTTLKINTAYKLFQFVAPDKDFGVKRDAKMTQLKRVIIIGYEDKQMRLVATAVDDKIDFCSAICWDKQTRKTYLLIDKPDPRGCPK